MFYSFLFNFSHTTLSISLNQLAYKKCYILMEN